MNRKSEMSFLWILLSLWLSACDGGEPLLAGGAVNPPSGEFSVSVYADDLPGARSLALGENGTLFVGTRGEGVVYAVRDEDGDHRADKTWVIARGLNMPNGVAVRDGSLYVAEIGRILRFDDIESRLDNPPPPVLVSDAFPEDRHHGWKFIAFGPDGKLYVPVGAPCNVCLSKDPFYASIWRLNPDGSGLEKYTAGVRNTVGFDWQPSTGDLWFTDNGRDWMGDDLPPDELNRAPRPGLHFGFPFRHGNDIPDPDFGHLEPPQELTPPEMELGAHVAALGIRFYTGGMFPERYRGGIFIAEHGSWNRSTKVGYRVVFVMLEDNRAKEQEVFIDGWLKDGVVSGRPVDVLIMPDGALLISDDYGGKVWRVAWTG